MPITQLLYKYYHGNSNHVIYHSIILIAILVGTIRFSKLSVSSKIFFLLLFITPFVELLGFYFAVKYRNNSPISNSFTVLEYCIFSLAFYLDSKIRTIIVLLIGMLMFVVFNSLLFQHFLNEQATNTALLSSLCEIIIFFLFLILYFKTVDSLPLGRFPLFWIGLGIMQFSIVSTVAFGYVELNTEGSWIKVARYARQYSNYILYLMFIPAFLSSQKRLRDFTGSR